MRCRKCVHYDLCEHSTIIDKEIQCKDFVSKEDFVEIVRCKDCEKAEELTVLGEKILSCRHWNTHTCEPTDFCRYGERAIK